MQDHADAVSLLTAYASQDAYQQTLRRDYLELLTAHADGTRRECRPDHLTASGLVIDPENERVLLGLHAKAKLWLQMGGHIEDWRRDARGCGDAGGDGGERHRRPDACGPRRRWRSTAIRRPAHRTPDITSTSSSSSLRRPEPCR